MALTAERGRPERGSLRRRIAPWRAGRRLPGPGRAVGVLASALRALALVLALALALVLARPTAGQDRASAPGQPSPRSYLIYLAHDGDPIVVSAYSEEGDAIVFEKYGGRVSIPRTEVVRIVRDGEPDSTAASTYLPEVSSDGSPLLMAARNGANLRVDGIRPEPDGRARLIANGGSLTMAQRDVLAILRVPRGGGIPEAWLFVTSSGAPAPSAVARPAPRGVGSNSLPYRASEQPHLLRLTNGQLVRVHGFWIEEGMVYFRRLGGIVGIALGEVARFFPEALAATAERLPAQFLEQLGPKQMRVKLGTDAARITLIGLEPATGAWSGEDPWRQLAVDSPVQLELDRRRHSEQGDLLAYVFLPNGLMLNAELIRLGFALPCADGANVRYLDLFHELAAEEEVRPCVGRPPSATPQVGSPSTPVAR